MDTVVSHDLTLGVTGEVGWKGQAWLALFHTHSVLVPLEAAPGATGKATVGRKRAEELSDHPGVGT